MTHGSRSIETAFVKQPLSGAVTISTLGIEGDEHVYEHHGGPDMALLIYPSEHYSYWRSVGLQLPDPAAMAENFTTVGLLETDVAMKFHQCWLSRCAGRPATKPLLQVGGSLRP